MKKIICLLVLFATMTVDAVLVEDVGIRYVGIYGNGRIFASLDKTIPVSGCASATWLMIEPTHTHKNEIYAMLLTASSAKKKLDVAASSCLSGSVTITEGTSDYIIMK